MEQASTKFDDERAMLIGKIQEVLETHTSALVDFGSSQATAQQELNAKNREIEDLRIALEEVTNELRTLEAAFSSHVSSKNVVVRGFKGHIERMRFERVRYLSSAIDLKRTVRQQNDTMSVYFMKNNCAPTGVALEDSIEARALVASRRSSRQSIQQTEPPLKIPTLSQTPRVVSIGATSPNIFMCASVDNQSANIPPPAGSIGAIPSALVFEHSTGDDYKTQDVRINSRSLRSRESAHRSGEFETMTM
ncbi:hypothetical protein HDU93_000771 [Gonapodya sp. JEL0774]|nr:hypothetical protein HDU93_000771 [Gonapodya sp. JEL0774]